MVRTQLPEHDGRLSHTSNFPRFCIPAAFRNVASWDFLLISSLAPGGEGFSPLHNDVLTFAVKGNQY